MKLPRYLALVAQSLRRNRRHFLLSGIGVVVGIATLFFFTSLGEGVRTTVLEDIFVIDRLEVVDPAAEAGIQSGELLNGEGLDDRKVERVEQIPGVDTVYPKMQLTFPSFASGGEALVGEDVGIEFIADGIPARLVEEDVEDDLGFQFNAPGRECSADDDCFDGQSCTDGQCTAQACEEDDDSFASACPGESYCHQQRNECALPVPILISPYLLEVYNGSIHTAVGDSHGVGSDLPQLTEEMLIGFEFDVVFGTSVLGRAGDVPTRRERVRLVGFSRQAMQLGTTMPLKYVEHLNREFSGDDAAEQFHSLLVETESNEDVASVAEYLEEQLGLALADRHRQAERAGLLILSLTLLFNFIALIILAVSAITITHTFGMMVMKRRVEIGLMRAIGATRRQVQSLVVGEASVVGLAAGVVGIALGIAASAAVDFVFDSYVPDFPFKPDTLFAWSPWMFALAVGTAVIFCLIGAYLPARRAGKIEPAEALTGR